MGSGPNGLAAAVIMARAGHEVHVYETSATVGGGMRTVPFASGGGVLDVCSAVHPMAVSSPFFTEFALSSRIQFHRPDVSYAHAMLGDSAVAYRDLDRTVEELGSDGARWGRVMRPLVENIEVVRALSGLSLTVAPRNLPGAAALATSATLGFSSLRGAARSLAAGAVAHSAAPLSSVPGRFVGAVLAAEAHVSGWPIPAGGSQAIANALVDDLTRHGGVIHVRHLISDLRSIWQPGQIAILDTSPQNAAVIMPVFPEPYSRALRRHRYGNAASKVDFRLSSPIPWSDDRLRDAGTVHVGGPAAHISYAEKQARMGIMPADPFVLVSQPTRFDRTRLSEGSARASEEIVWSYAHVPNGSSIDATEIITRRIETFAPGFRDVVLHSESRSAIWYEDHNSNFVGGDVLGGRIDIGQFLTRPTLSLTPWRTPVQGVYLCSAATPPGAGVHGMGGWHAARVALRDHGARDFPPLTPKA